MAKLYNYIIVLNFFLVWIGFYLPEQIKTSIGLLGILSIGLIHGSNDIFLIKNIQRQQPILKYIFYYSFFIISFAVAFYLIPIVSLPVFILTSAYHFGEQHWQKVFLSAPNYIKQFFFICYGNLVIGLILYFNQAESTLIIENLSDFKVTNTIYFFNVLVSAFLTLSSYILCTKKINVKTSTIVLNLFYLLVFTASFYVSGLIWSFALYFVLWHSLPSLKDQIDFSFGGFNFQNVLIYLKQSLTYWLISIIGLIVFYLLLKDTKYILSILFAFIASVTIPHVFVVKKMFEKKASN
ncbi:Brp/Blh family beta-carotene 15,15'-dioxygenase [Psychroflexus sp. ALD_RP9]|uniref:Brp/Blh family beta-carotene 15,15'-dioxygenase n=1 Tax=Psychroflexus sp. ALD_RP9 TaxID=2777186 RepID=UPI001A90861E|nr:Brp/Blh family beta-carotene 15,15'-dioxygenase [Psychroflexus sp. ALD_RP9]QSS97046.1 Brp/Blh family beta-carotene 15,15'-dioxygenase [Psychroflexus sp. ALD_RP9]